jgi:antitoxin CcdA
MQERIKPRKRAVNLSIDASLLDEAKAAGTNLSALLERAIENELRSSREERLKAELRPSIDAHNQFIEKHGLFSDEWRKF